MKYLAIVLSLLFLPIEAVGQRFALGLNVSPTISFRTFNYKGANQTILNAIKNNEKPIYTYTAGLSVAYLCTRQVQVNSGVQYSKLGYAITNIGVNTRQAGVVTDLSINYLHSLIDIPIILTYSITKPNRTFSWFIATGIINSFSLNSTYDLKTSKIGLFTNEEIANINNAHLQKVPFYNFSYRLGTGICINVDEKHQIRIEAIFRVGLSAIYDNSADLKRNLNAGALSFTFYKKLGRLIDVN
jgi:hypothetical protein